jgi:hypothetical protein
VRGCRAAESAAWRCRSASPAHSTSSPAARPPAGQVIDAPADGVLARAPGKRRRKRCRTSGGPTAAPVWAPTRGTGATAAGAGADCIRAAGLRNRRAPESATGWLASGSWRQPVVGCGRWRQCRPAPRKKPLVEANSRDRPARKREAEPRSGKRCSTAFAGVWAACWFRSHIARGRPRVRAGRLTHQLRRFDHECSNFLGESDRC